MEPTPKETQTEFVGRCIPHEMNVNGMPQKQAIAVCYSKWTNRNKKKEAK